MTSEQRQGERAGRSPGLLGLPALIPLLVGAVGSEGFMLYAGRRNHSRVLLALFALWILAPFVLLFWAGVRSKRWSLLTRVTLHSLMLVVSLGCLATYGYTAFSPPRSQAAFAFVVIPPASCLLTAIALASAALLSGRR